MLFLSEDDQSDVIEAFNSTYLDDLLNIKNDFFDSMVNRIYLYRMVLLRLKFMIYEMILILILCIFYISRW